MVSIVEMWRPHRLIRPFLGVGLLGGYTTFSTYAIETQRLIQAGDARIAFIYFVATLLGAMLAVQAGVLLYAFRERCFRGGEDDLARPGVPAHHPSGVRMTNGTTSRCTPRLCTGRTCLDLLARRCSEAVETNAR